MDQINNNFNNNEIVKNEGGNEIILPQEKCKLCLYCEYEDDNIRAGDPKQEEEMEILGECRYDPPRLVINPNYNVETDPIEDMVISFWPPVGIESGWCGKFITPDEKIHNDWIDRNNLA